MSIFIDDWKKSWRFLSMRYALFVAVLPEALYRLAEIAADWFPTLAGPVMDNLPEPVRQGAAILAAGAIFFRLKKQAALHAPPKEVPPDA